MNYNPLTFEEIKDRLKNAPAWQFGCWICWNARGMFAFQTQSLISGTWALKVACKKCVPKVKGKIYKI